MFPSGLAVFNNTTPAALTLGGQQVVDNNNRANSGVSADSASELSTSQIASAELFYNNNGAASYSTGTTDQVFDFNASSSSTQDTTTELYHRHVRAANAFVVEDVEKLLGMTVQVPTPNATNLTAKASPLNLFEGDSAQAMLGRGPGQPRRQLVEIEAVSSSLVPLNGTARRLKLF